MKAIGLYLLLVGIPVLAVLGILRLGENLIPPISVGGVWSIERSPQSAVDPSCGDLPIALDQPVLTIIQSGTHLQLMFNDKGRTTLAGVLHENTITTVDGVDAVQLQASIDRQTEPDSLRGVLTFTGCPSHAPMRFAATHQKASH